MKEAGRMIAKLSTVSFDRSGEIGSDGSIKAFPGWDSFRGGLLSLLMHEKVAENLTDAVVGKLKEIIDSNAEILAGLDRARNLVHGDFRPDNILVSEGSIAGLLDWEFGHSGSSFMDIGNLLRHFPGDFDHDLAEGLRDEGFDLPGNWRFQACLIDLASHLEFLTSTGSNRFKQECVKRVEQMAL